MALTKEQKENIIKELKENIAKQKAMVFVSVEGLKASELFDLRKRLKGQGCKLVVVKKTLLNLIFDINPKELQGQLALIFGFEDELSPAKIAYNFSKENKNLKILAGYLKDKFRNAEEIIALAKIPSREELLARIVGTLSASISGLSNVLQANIKGLVYTLSRINQS